MRYNHSRRKPQPPAGARQFQQEQLRAAQQPSLAATSGSPQGDPVKAALLHPLPFNYLLLGSLCKGSPARRADAEGIVTKAATRSSPQGVRTKRPSAPSDACHKGSLLIILSILSSPVVPSTVDGHTVRKPALENKNSYRRYKRAFRNRALRTKAHKGLPTQEPFLPENQWERSSVETSLMLLWERQ